MELKVYKYKRRWIAQCVTRSGFTLIENMVAIGIVGFLFSAIYAGMSMNVGLVRMCRENETATQILVEKFDTIRLYNWQQLNSNGFIPKKFTLGIDPANTNSPPYYTGTVSIAQTSITEPYKTNMLQVTVTLNWTSNRRAQTRSMTSYAAKYGLQSYVY